MLQKKKNLNTIEKHTFSTLLLSTERIYSVVGVGAVSDAAT